MKQLLLTTLLLWASASIGAQNLINKTISYQNFNKYLSAEDSIRITDQYKAYDPIMINQFFPADKELYTISQDTLLLCEFNENKGYPRALIYSTSQTATKINGLSGQSSRHKDYSKRKYHNIKNYKRIEQEDRVIEGYTTKAYYCKSKQGWQKLWLANSMTAPSDFFYSTIFIDGHWIFKKETYFEGKQIRVKHFTGLSDTKDISIGQTITQHTKNNIQQKYSPLIQNLKLPEEAVQIGSTVPNFYYREVLGDKTVDLYSISSKSDYTALEFWGSWCMPCLVATKSIKKMRDQFTTDKLAILSFNTRDRQIEKVKNVIETKGMNWQHGYSTQKIITLLNEKGQYPTMVVINKANEVVFIGHPGADYEQIVALIK